VLFWIVEIGREVGASRMAVGTRKRVDIVFVDRDGHVMVPANLQALRLHVQGAEGWLDDDTMGVDIDLSGYGQDGSRRLSAAVGWAARVDAT
jgi:hypothetical protein